MASRIYPPCHVGRTHANIQQEGAAQNSEESDELEGASNERDNSVQSTSGEEEDEASTSGGLTRNSAAEAELPAANTSGFLKALFEANEEPSASEVAVSDDEDSGRDVTHESRLRLCSARHIEVC